MLKKNKKALEETHEKIFLISQTKKFDATIYYSEMRESGTSHTAGGFVN